MIMVESTQSESQKKNIMIIWNYYILKKIIRVTMSISKILTDFNCFHLLIMKAGNIFVCIAPTVFLQKIF